MHSVKHNYKEKINMKKLLLTLFASAIFVLPAAAATFNASTRVPVVGKQIVTKNGLPSSITFKVVEGIADNSKTTTDNVLNISTLDLAYAGNDNEVAAVVANQLGHILNASVSKKKLRDIATAAVTSNFSEDNIVNVAAYSQFNQDRLTLNDNMDADITGADLLITAGYNPLAMVVWVTKQPGSTMEAIKGDPANSKRAMNIYDYLTYNYPSKVKAGYACNEYRFFLTYADPIVKDRNSNKKKLAKFNKEQAKKKAERAKQIAKYRATGGVSGWDASYTILKTLSESSEI